MTRDDQLKKLKAFVNDLLSHHGNLRSGVYHLMKNHELIVDGEKANWLSEKLSYRVALHQCGGNFFTDIADNEQEKHEQESEDTFVKWLTDWQEYDI